MNFEDAKEYMSKATTWEVQSDIINEFPYTSPSQNMTAKQKRVNAKRAELTDMVREKAFYATQEDALRTKVQTGVLGDATTVLGYNAITENAIERQTTKSKTHEAKIQGMEMAAEVFKDELANVKWGGADNLLKKANKKLQRQKWVVQAQKDQSDENIERLRLFQKKADRFASFFEKGKAETEEFAISIENLSIDD